MKIASTEDRVYITPVKKEKQTSFICFLRSLKIKKDEITISSNGDFYIFTIDLSDKSASDFSKIRKSLNEQQVAFLR